MTACFGTGAAAITARRAEWPGETVLGGPNRYSQYLLTLVGMTLCSKQMSRRTRSRRRRARLLFAACAVAALAPIAGVFFAVRAVSPKSRNLSHSVREISVTKPAAKRPVYPYSVVPGGVYSADEFRAAVQRDHIVAEHYAIFSSSHLKQSNLMVDGSAYVSYRVGEGVYWTRRPVRLSRGEQVLADGEHLIRARCGNRISSVPRFPVLPEEPPEITNNDGLEPPPSPRRYMPVAGVSEAVDSFPELPVLPPLEPSVEIPKIPQPPVSTLTSQRLIPPGGQRITPVTPPIHPPVVPPPPPPVAVVPEPNSVILLGSVITALAVAGILRKRKPRP